MIACPKPQMASAAQCSLLCMHSMTAGLRSLVMLASTMYHHSLLCADVIAVSMCIATIVLPLLLYRP